MPLWFHQTQIWPWYRRTSFAWWKPRFFCFELLKSIHFSTLRFSAWRSLNSRGSHLSSLLFFPIANKYLLIVSCGTCRASNNCCWVWVGSSSNNPPNYLPSNLCSLPEPSLFFDIRISTFKLSKPCHALINGACSLYVSVRKRWALPVFFFWLNKNSKAAVNVLF